MEQGQIEVLRRARLLHFSPVWAEMSLEEQRAMDERLLDARSWADLADADKELIRRGGLAIAAGRSVFLQNPADWGDWEAIDAAVDAEDDDALDKALDTVAAAQGDPPPVVIGDGADDHTDESAVDDDDTDDAEGEPAYAEADEAGWVGL